MENKRPNPIALTEQDITTYGRSTVIGFHDRNNSETLFPGTTHKDLLLKKISWMGTIFCRYSAI